MPTQRKRPKPSLFNLCIGIVTASAAGVYGWLVLFDVAAPPGEDLTAFVLMQILAGTYTAGLRYELEKYYRD